MELTLSEANSIVTSAIAKAEALGVRVAVAVCGRDGRLVAFSKMDGAGNMTARRAIGKAIVQRHPELTPWRHEELPPMLFALSD